LPSKPDLAKVAIVVFYGGVLVVGTVVWLVGCAL
jgi:hypothetical protein